MQTAAHVSSTERLLSSPQLSTNSVLCQSHLPPTNPPLAEFPPNTSDVSASHQTTVDVQVVHANIITSAELPLAHVTASSNDSQYQGSLPGSAVLFHPEYLI